MSLIILIILATVSYTFYDIFASRSGGKIDPNMGSVIFNGLGAIIPLLIYSYLRINKFGGLIMPTRQGIIYSVLAGVSIATFSIIFIKIFEKGDLSYVIPAIYGGTILLASIVGIIIFKESYSLMKIMGIIIILIGVVLVTLSQSKVRLF